MSEQLTTNYQWLDQLDLSSYLIDGSDFYETIDKIEKDFNNIILNEYNSTVFEFMNEEDIMFYLYKRYNIKFIPIKTWRLYRNDGTL